MAHSLLTVPVPELDKLVRDRLGQRSPEDLPLEVGDTVAHVTLLGPFAPREEITDGVLTELARFFADVTPFSFSLTGVSRFPSGTVYLSPSPAAPFRQLTHQLARRFPEYPPYGGAFDDVLPHLSIPVLPDEDLETIEWELAPLLPVTAYAQEAALYWWEPGAGGTLDVFPFGTTAA